MEAAAGGQPIERNRDAACEQAVVVTGLCHLKSERGFPPVRG